MQQYYIKIIYFRILNDKKNVTLLNLQSSHKYKKDEPKCFRKKVISHHQTLKSYIPNNCESKKSGNIPPFSNMIPNIAS